MNIVHHSTMWAFQLSNFTMEWGDMWVPIIANSESQHQWTQSLPQTTIIRIITLLSVQDPNYIGGT